MIAKITIYVLSKSGITKLNIFNSKKKTNKTLKYA